VDTVTISEPVITPGSMTTTEAPTAVRQRLAAGALAVVVAATTALSIALAAEPSYAGGTAAAARQVVPQFAAGSVLSLLMGGLQLARRRHPGGVLVASAAAIVGYQLLGFPAIGTVWPLLVPLFGAAAAGRLGLAIGVAATLSAASAGWRLVVEREVAVLVLVGELQGLAVVGLAVATGAAAWQRGRWAQEVRRRAAAAAAATRREADRAMTAQRFAVAAELHDVAAHNLVVIGLQLHLAQETLGDDPESARRAIRIALATHDRALSDTAAAVRLLRTESGLTQARPASGPTDVHRLVAVAADARLDLRVDTADDLALPDVLARVAFRVCQEALTNTLRHTAARQARLSLARDGGGVRIRFTDDGGAPRPTPRATPGHGLTCMAERVRRVGGRLSAGPDGSGAGFVVDAWLPLEASPAPVTS
jgi:signal transduction histidine kinase